MRQFELRLSDEGVPHPFEGLYWYFLYGEGDTSTAPLFNWR